MHGNVELLVFVIGCAVMVMLCVSMTFTGYPVIGVGLGLLFGSMGLFTGLDLRRGRGDASGGGGGESDGPTPDPPRGGPSGGRDPNGGGGSRVPAQPKKRPPSGRAATGVRPER